MPIAAQPSLGSEASGPDGSEQLPLLVDLDRDLLRVNLVHEALTGLMLSRPAAALDAIWHGRRAHGTVARAVADRTTLDLTTLPHDTEVLQMLLRERARGRRLALQAGASEPWARQIAEHLGITGSIDAGEAAAEVERLRPSRRRVPPGRSLLRAARPHQWLKNLLVLVALFTAQKVEHGTLTLRALAMFASFCLVSSSVYVLNDMADLTADRRHATKRGRPFASGEVGVLTGWLLWPLLLALGGTLAALTVPYDACLWLLAYYAGTVVYTFGAKRVAILDVIVLAGLYTVRIIAGAAAISVPTSIWLLTFSMSIFTSLALVKRVSELTRVIEAHGALRGRGYEPRDLGTLKSLGVTASYAAVVVLALYVHDPGTSRLYENPNILWLVVPLMLYWTSRLWLLADRGEIDEDPLLFATRDRVSYVVMLATVAAFVAAKFVA